jgi:uncharacterized protein YndB with AHSA1/START domain
MLIVTNTITINANAESVWQILTLPEHTAKYMFGCRTVSDWKVGSLLDWKMMHEGNEIVPVTGMIKVIEPFTLLQYTVIDPFASYPIIPENHLNVTYRLEEKSGITTLTVTQDGFETVAEGEKRYEDVNNNGDGWNPILVQIKAIAEQL